VGYQCHGGSPLYPDTCWELCGDGYNFGGEQCDDGNLIDGDGCSSFCTLEDGFICVIINANGECKCTEICGDGLNMGVNPCDDRNTISGDGCSDVCDVELGWTCGLGDFARFDLCFEVCGDGRAIHSITPPGNMCDDGNNYNGDGCDANCILEHGMNCTGGDLYTPDTCFETCGDGYHLGLLPCDDGNILSNSDFKTLFRWGRMLQHMLNRSWMELQRRHYLDERYMQRNMRGRKVLR